MTTYLIQPRDRVVLGDGAGAEGNRRRTLPFPWPSTIAGMMRTRAGSDASGRFILNPDEAKQLLTAVSVRGPILCETKSQEAPEVRLYFPAPRDQVLLRGEAGFKQWRLTPQPTPRGGLTDLKPDAQEAEALSLVGLCAQAGSEKVARGPAFWSEKRFFEWLKAPGASETPRFLDETTAQAWIDGSGGESIQQLEQEERTHVAIGATTHTAAEGQLFSTRGLRFSRNQNSQLSALGLFVDCTLEPPTPAQGRGPHAPHPGALSFGGERTVTELKTAPRAWPDCPDEVKNAESLVRRIILITPALFDGGSLPTSKKLFGAKIIAALTPRPESISGWDFARRTPKPSRRMLPAGSVFWVEIPQGKDKATWCAEAWLQHTSSDAQDRRDGFGLCVVGVK